MIFISGVHGVGKSYFCNKVKEKLHINAYQSSQLIAERKNVHFSSNKKVANIDNNQNLLIQAIEELNEKEQKYLLDGHFCLLNVEGGIHRIDKQTYIDLQPQAIILLTENPEVIASRRRERDNIEIDVVLTRDFQDEEEKYAKVIATELGIPLYISKGNDTIGEAIEFIAIHIM